VPGTQLVRHVFARSPFEAGSVTAKTRRDHRRLDGTSAWAWDASVAPSTSTASVAAAVSPQPDRVGSFQRLIFPEPVSGLVALGFGCHYGLGLFRLIR
jgi:CRISPR-associated protein Csb2